VARKKEGLGRKRRETLSGVADVSRHSVASLEVFQLGSFFERLLWELKQHERKTRQVSSDVADHHCCSDTN